MLTEEFALEGIITHVGIKITFPKGGGRQRALVLKVESPQPLDMTDESFDELNKAVGALAGKKLRLRAETIQLPLPFAASLAGAPKQESVLTE